ncbi:MAG: PAS domain-containing protein [Alphaproteobacteria bacterium]|nr:PAS domain-containing protein [Alphaproteobacteria bacterium]
MVKVNYQSYDERRLTQRLYRYWQEKSAGRPFPAENDIDPDELGADWENCFLVQVRDIVNVTDYNYTFLGANIMEAYRGNLKDQHNEFMVGPNAHKVSKSFGRVLTTRAPVMEEGELVTLSGHMIKYRQCMLPLGTADGVVEAVFGGLSFKYFDPEAE